MILDDRFVHVCTLMGQCRPLMNNPPSLNREYNGDPNIKATTRVFS